MTGSRRAIITDNKGSSSANDEAMMPSTTARLTEAVRSCGSEDPGMSRSPTPADSTVLVIPASRARVTGSSNAYDSRFAYATPRAPIRPPRSPAATGSGPAYPNRAAAARTR